VYEKLKRKRLNSNGNETGLNGNVIKEGFEYIGYNSFRFTSV